MKKEYDFSKAERGKFFKANAKAKLPIYLNAENLSFVQEVAKRNKTDMNSVVNGLIKNGRQVAKILAK